MGTSRRLIGRIRPTRRQPMSEFRTITEVIPDALAGQRIDRVVSLASGLSRRQAVTLLNEGRVTIDGLVPDKPSQRVAIDNVVIIEVPISGLGSSLIRQSRSTSSTPTPMWLWSTKPPVWSSIPARG